MSTATAAPASTPTPAQVGSATPSSAGEIHVRPGTLTQTAPPKATPAAPTARAEAPAAAPAAKSATESMFDDLRSKARPANGAKGPNEAPATPPEEVAPGAEEDGVEPVATSEEAEPKTAAEKAGEQPKKKVNPWEVIKQNKAERAALEKQIAEMKKLVADPEARKSEVERLAAIEKRNKELEDHIRFVDYSKSEDFKEKFEKPYEQKWAQTMSELRDVTISDPSTGEERTMTPQDMLQLVNLPLNKAMELAKEMYGDSASIMMNYRSELRNLFKAKTDALEKARTEGSEKIKRDAETSKAKMTEVQTQAAKHWEDANQAILANEKTGHYFRPIDGDTEMNQRLEAGFKLVDEVMAMNPFDPNLSEEQRANVVQKHAAVRARAAGFGRLRAMNEAKDKTIADLKKRLSQYEESEPTTTGTSPAAAGGSGRESADSRWRGALRKMAK